MQYREDGPDSNLPEILGADELPALFLFRPRGSVPSYFALSDFQSEEPAKEPIPGSASIKRLRKQTFLARLLPAPINASSAQEEEKSAKFTARNILDFLSKSSDGAIDIPVSPSSPPPRQSPSNLTGFDFYTLVAAAILTAIAGGAAIAFIWDGYFADPPDVVAARLDQEEYRETSRGFWYKLTYFTPSDGGPGPVLMQDDCDPGDNSFMALLFGSLFYALFLSGLYLCYRNGFPIIGLTEDGSLMLVWRTFRGQLMIEAIYMVVATAAVSTALYGFNKGVCNTDPNDRSTQLVTLLGCLVAAVGWVLWLFSRKHHSYPIFGT